MVLAQSLTLSLVNVHMHLHKYGQTCGQAYKLICRGRFAPKQYTHSFAVLPKFGAPHFRPLEVQNIFRCISIS